jgi:hypothetical protein
MLFNEIIQATVGAGLPRPAPIDRPVVAVPLSALF